MIGYGIKDALYTNNNQPALATGHKREHNKEIETWKNTRRNGRSKLGNGFRNITMQRRGIFGRSTTSKMIMNIQPGNISAQKRHEEN